MASKLVLAVLSVTVFCLMLSQVESRKFTGDLKKLCANLTGWPEEELVTYELPPIRHGCALKCGKPFKLFVSEPKLFLEDNGVPCTTRNGRKGECRYGVCKSLDGKTGPICPMYDWDCD